MSTKESKNSELVGGILNTASGTVGDIIISVKGVVSIAKEIPRSRKRGVR